MRKICAMLCAALSLFSLPQGFECVGGEAFSSQDQNTLLIQSGEKAVVHWESFSIGVDEHVHFLQASENASVLNRVLGPSPSDILGRLSSNGAIYLINPNGILIGPDAAVEAASFIGSTLDVLTQDFLEDHALLFEGDSDAAIVNQGTLTCSGDILFIARACVDNAGELFARRIGMAIGSEVLIQPKGQNGIYIKAALSENLSQELEENSPYRKAIKHSGDSFSLQEENGEIYLIASEGVIEVDGKIHAESGQIHILGENIYLTEHTDIDTMRGTT